MRIKFQSFIKHLSNLNRDARGFSWRDRSSQWQQEVIKILVHLFCFQVLNLTLAVRKSFVPFRPFQEVLFLVVVRHEGDMLLMQNRHNAVSHIYPLLVLANLAQPVLQGLR